MPRSNVATLGALAGTLLLLPGTIGGGATQARQLAPGTAVFGRIVDGTTNSPVAGALVTLAGGNPVRRVIAGATGQFEFNALPAGSYTVRADRPGYLSTTAGQRSPGGLGQPVALTAGQRAQVDLSMWKASSIGGRVVAATPAATPIVGAEIHALARTVVGGEWRWTESGHAMSDDRGRYQIGSLPPADYLVVARPVQDPETPLLIALLTANPASAADVMAGVGSTSHATPDLDARVLSSALAYYAAPNASAARPSFVAVGPAVAKIDVDVRVRQSHGVRVSGRLTGAAAPTSGLVVRLLATIPDANGRERGDQDIEVDASACDADGRFEFSGIAAGQYALDVSWMPPIPAQPSAELAGRGGPRPPTPVLPFSSEPALSARTTLAVGANDVTNVDVPVRAGLRMAGRVVTADASRVGAGDDSTAIALESTSLRLEPVAPPFVAVSTIIPPRVAVDRNGRISSASMPPGLYIMRATAPRGWTVVSAMTGGVDILDRPIDIAAEMTDLTVTLADRPLGVIAGSIATAAGPTSEVLTVIAFPTQADLRHDSTAASRRIRAVRAQDSGAFSIGNLPPGEYAVLAIPGDAPAGWQRAETLASFERSTQRVNLSLGATERVTLEVRR